MYGSSWGAHALTNGTRASTITAHSVSLEPCERIVHMASDVNGRFRLAPRALGRDAEGETRGARFDARETRTICRRAVLCVDRRRGLGGSLAK